MALRLRHVAQINPDTPAFNALAEDAEVTFVPLEAVWSSGIDLSQRRKKADFGQGYSRFKEGDVLVPKITPTFQADRSTIARGLFGGLGIGTTELHVIRCGPELDSRYLGYVVSSRPFLLGGEAGMIGVAGQKRVPDEWIRNFPVPCTVHSTQRAIADFLDAETARIDALTVKKRRMIELLALRAVATVDHLVLGLSRESGRSARTIFFERIPGHWLQTSARHLGCSVQTGPFGSQLHAEDYVDDGWPVVNPANLRDGRIVPIATMAVSEEKRAELSRHTLRLGDIVFGRRGEMGRAGIVTSAQVGWLCGTGSLRLRLVPGSPLSAEYLKLLLETMALRRYFELASIGSTMDNLNSDIVLSMPCVVPPTNEQDDIVERVNALRSEVAALSDRLTEQSLLLREHREALITAAVTGEIVIPGAAA